MNDLNSNKNNENSVVEPNSTQVFQSKEKDKQSGYFSERAKKLVTAIYLVTGLIPQTDPLRQTIRKFAVNILAFIGRVPAGYSLSTATTEAGLNCRKISEMLEVAFFSGYVSEMNYSVLKAELDLFATEITENKNLQDTVRPDFLRVRPDGVKMSDKTLAITDKTDRVEKTTQAEKTDKGQKNQIETSIQATQSISKPMSQVVSQERVISPSTPSKGITEAKKLSRKEAILSIIKRRGSVNIKDISSVIINCSEKTIQRELTGLVDEGTLKRTGERRWSVYSLA